GQPPSIPGKVVFDENVVPREYRNDPYNFAAMAKLGISLKQRGFDSFAQGDSPSGYEIKAMMDTLSPLFPGESPASIGHLIAEVMSETGQTVEQATQTVAQQAQGQQAQGYQQPAGEPELAPNGRPWPTTPKGWFDLQQWTAREEAKKAAAESRKEWQQEAATAQKADDRKRRMAERRQGEDAALDAVLEKYGIKASSTPAKVTIGGREVELDLGRVSARELLRSQAWRAYEQRVDPHDPDRDVKLAGMDEGVISEMASQILPLLRGNANADMAAEAARHEQVPAATLVETAGGRAQRPWSDMSLQEVAEASFDEVANSGQMPGRGTISGG
ncbi:MAG TPA: hypothetical protein VM243_02625, partial [Phycisphaerae bacterium]|nr:hypothetical protein [Phycisphaerae bacterium]